MQSPNAGKPHAVCGAKTRSGLLCQSRPVRGTARCRMHGGTSPGRPIETGRYSLVHRQSLHEKVQGFLADSRPGDLSDELALMRALLQDYLGRFGDGVALPAMEIERIMGMIETISRLVERIARILNTTALTAAEVQLLQARIVDLLVKYVDDPQKRLAFLDDLATAFNGDRRDTQPVIAGELAG